MREIFCTKLPADWITYIFFYYLTIREAKFPDKSWIAPEMYRTRRYTKQANMFTLGCLFGYTLSDGIHPFGNDPYARNHRIMKMESMTMTQNDLKWPYLNDQLAFKLIQSMLDFEPTRRPTTDTVWDHPFLDGLHTFVFQSGESEGKYILDEKSMFFGNFKNKTVSSALFFMT